MSSPHDTGNEKSAKRKRAEVETVSPPHEADNDKTYSREVLELWLDDFVKTGKANSNHWKKIETHLDDIEEHVELPSEKYLLPDYFKTPEQRMPKPIPAQFAADPPCCWDCLRDRIKRSADIAQARPRRRVPRRKKGEEFILMGNGIGCSDSQIRHRSVVDEACKDLNGFEGTTFTVSSGLRSGSSTIFELDMALVTDRDTVCRIFGLIIRRSMFTVDCGKGSILSTMLSQDDINPGLALEILTPAGGVSDMENYSESQGSGASRDDGKDLDFAIIEKIEVNKACRKQGVGTYMVNRFLTEAENYGACYVYTAAKYIEGRPEGRNGMSDIEAARARNAENAAIKVAFKHFFRSLGFRRFGETEYFAYAMDEERRRVPCEPKMIGMRHKAPQNKLQGWV